MDSSGSILNDYSKEKNFLKSLAASFQISKDGARAGVITFSSNVKLSIRLNDHFNLDDFNDAVDEIPHMNHTTRIDRALRMTQQEMFTAANGGRSEVKKIIIILTDGVQTRKDVTDLEEPSSVAKELRNMGYTVLAVGIGNGADENELAAITGDGNHVYTADTFEELVTEEFLEKVNKKGCEEGNYISFFTNVIKSLHSFCCKITKSNTCQFKNIFLTQIHVKRRSPSQI